MAVGCEGWVSLTVDTEEDLLLGTGGSIPKVRPDIQSQSGYGGQINDSGPSYTEMAIGFPHTHDFVQYEGSIEFEATEGVITRQIKPWLFDRQGKAQVHIHPRDAASQRFDSAFWSSISLSAGEGGVVSSSISFSSEGDRDNFDRGTGYVANKTGQGFLCDTSPPANWNIPGQLNPSSGNIEPIPFWNTSIVIDGSTVEFTNWTVEFTQSFNRFFACENNSTPQEAKIVGVGPVSIRFTGDYMFVGTPAFTVSDTLSTLVINVGGETISLSELELTSDSDDIRGQGDLAPVGIEYAAYGIAA